MPDHSIVPVLILGGQENTLCLTRSFGRRGVPVYISATIACLAVRSRYCRGSYTAPPNRTVSEYWQELLLDVRPPALAGSVIFPCSDEAVEFLARHREALGSLYTLDEADPGVSLAMLDKQKTLELANRAGCPAPAFHRVDAVEDLAAFSDAIDYPVMIKPVHSHLFQQHYPNRKYLIAGDAGELHELVSGMLARNLRLIVTEIIPGPDHLQSSFFTYRSPDGRELFSYTHQIIRRYPRNSGLSCMTVTRALPGTAAMGRRFFESAGLTGMAHVEFKLDPRDSRLKLIECNPRMSAAQAIVTRSGLDMAWRIYDYLLNGTVQDGTSYRYGVRRWWVYLDFRAFLELRRRGELSLAGWIRTVKGPPLVFPYFSLDDPKPVLIKLSQTLFSTFKTGAYLLCQSVKESLISSSRVLSRRFSVK